MLKEWVVVWLSMAHELVTSLTDKHASLFLALYLFIFPLLCLSPESVRLGSQGSRGYVKWMWIWVRKQRDVT